MKMTWQLNSRRLGNRNPCWPNWSEAAISVNKVSFQLGLIACVLTIGIIVLLKQSKDRFWQLQVFLNGAGVSVVCFAWFQLASEITTSIYVSLLSGLLIGHISIYLAVMQENDKRYCPIIPILLVFFLLTIGTLISPKAVTACCYGYSITCFFGASISLATKKFSKSKLPVCGGNTEEAME